jgi:hypothetical protein
LPRACQHNASLKLPQFVYTAELFGLIAAYPSQFNAINTSVAMHGATEFWRCKHPGPCGFSGTSVLHSARCRCASRESNCNKFSTNSNGKTWIVKSAMDFTPPHIIGTDPSYHTHILREDSVLTSVPNCSQIKVLISTVYTDTNNEFK